MGWENGWCIEHEDSEQSHPMYLVLDKGQIDWSYDSLKAFRMARFDDAKAFTEVFLSGRHRVAEHGWGP
jgi:hypothetical protein